MSNPIPEEELLDIPNATIYRRQRARPSKSRKNRKGEKNGSGKKSGDDGGGDGDPDGAAVIIVFIQQSQPTKSGQSLVETFIKESIQFLFKFLLPITIAALVVLTGVW